VTYRPRQPLVGVGELGGPVPVVASERFVSPVAAEHDGHLTPGQAGDQIRGQQADIPKRLVEGVL
jgi:hypothetical protein